MVSYEWPRPIVTADAVVLYKNKILLIKRGIEPHKGSYCLPGGHMDDNENSLMCAKREVLEETGIIIDCGRLIGIYENEWRDPRRQWGVNISYLFELYEYQKPVGADDAESAEWIDSQEVQFKRIPLAFDHYNIVLDALSLSKN